MIIDSNEMLKSILDAFSYNRSAEHMMQLLNELHLRIYGRYTNWSEDGDIIYSMMVICFGDYGTSPRSGWFEEDSVKKNMHDALDEYYSNIRAGDM